MSFWIIKNVYHGTNLSGDFFHTFDPAKTGAGNDELGSGYYLTDRESTARGYANQKKDGAGENSHPYLYVCDVSFSKPFFAKTSGDDAASLEIPVPKSALALFTSNVPNLTDPDTSPIGNWHEVPKSVSDCFALARNIMFEHYWNDGCINANLFETDWFRGKSQLFRDLLRASSGYDGVIANYGDSNNFVAWHIDQINIKEIYRGKERVR